MRPSRHIYALCCELYGFLYATTLYSRTGIHEFTLSCGYTANFIAHHIVATLIIHKNERKKKVYVGVVNICKHSSSGWCYSVAIHIYTGLWGDVSNFSFITFIFREHNFEWRKLIGFYFLTTPRQRIVNFLFHIVFTLSGHKFDAAVVLPYFSTHFWKVNMTKYCIMLLNII